MQLGFVSLILRDVPLEGVMRFGAEQGFDCVELMCWPAESSGVTHIDVAALDRAAIERIKGLEASTGVRIASLGYYANPLTPEVEVRKAAIAHIRRVMEATAELGVPIMNTYVGRDPKRSIQQNWPAFTATWEPLVAYAEHLGIRLGTENCPMLFSEREWPGGENLAISPEVWRAMFESIPSESFGLVFDPSHLLWMGIDHLRAMREFHQRFVTVQIKDEKIDPERLYQRGVLGLGWHHPKIPGLGSIDWAEFWHTLEVLGYDGDVLIEVQDRSFGTDLQSRMDATIEAKRHVDLARAKGALRDG